MKGRKAPNPPDLRPYGPGDLQRDFKLSLEDMGCFDVYVSLLQRWQRHHNLVGSSTLADVWRRHLLDSLQLVAFAAPGDSAATWVDLGSGAGFPGLALAIYYRHAPGFHIYLVESTGKKCGFLREVIHHTGAPATVIEKRLEQLSLADFAGQVAVITARAFAPLPRLLDLAAPICGPETKILLLKGQYVDNELTEAAKYWNIRAIKHKSRAGSAGFVLEITEATRA